MSTAYQSLAAELPLEILTQIFNDRNIPVKHFVYFTKDERRDLMACSLVCSRWRFAAQRKLYRQISIDYDHSPSPDLYNAIANSRPGAHIAAYIQHIYITDPPYNHVFTGDADFAKFLQRLAELGNVRTISLGPSYYSGFPEHGMFSPENHDAFFRLLRSPNIISLIIEQGDGFPLNSLSCCSGLAFLSLSFPGLERKFRAGDPGYQDDFEEHRSEEPVKLQELSIHAQPGDILRVANFFANPGNNLSTDWLRKVKLEMAASDPGSIFKICGSVEDLVMDFTSVSLDTTGFLHDENKITRPHKADISALKSLRRLTVVARVLGSLSEEPWKRFIPIILEGWILEILRHLTRPDLLESVKVLVWSYPNSSKLPVDRAAELMNSCWARWNKLVQGGKFPSLKRVEMRLPWVDDEVAPYWP